MVYKSSQGERRGIASVFRREEWDAQPTRRCLILLKPQGRLVVESLRLPSRGSADTTPNNSETLRQIILKATVLKRLGSRCNASLVPRWSQRSPLCHGPQQMQKAEALDKLGGRKYVFEANPAQQFHADAVQYYVCNFSAVARWIDMNTVRALSKRSIDYVHDGFSDRRGICIRRHDGCKTLHDSFAEALVWAVIIFSYALIVGRPTRMSEVIGATRERARDDDRRFDAPQRQLARHVDFHRIHTGLRREIRSQIRRRPTRSAAAADPDYESLLLLP